MTHVTCGCSVGLCWRCLCVVISAMMTLLSTAAADLITILNIPDDSFQQKPVVALDMCVALHKMRVRHGQWEAIAPGANERADFFLIACNRVGNETPRCIAWIYHTTNAEPHTFDPCSGVVIPETRLLGRCIDSVVNVMNTAVAQLALEVNPHKHQSLGGVLPCALPVPTNNGQEGPVMGDSSRSDASSTASHEENESDEVEWDNDI